MLDQISIMLYEYFDATQVMDAMHDEVVFTSPLPSPAPRALSRSSSLASNGSASPNHHLNGGGGSSAGPKQIFVKVGCWSAYTTHTIQGRSNWILHRKWKYSI